VSKDLTIDVGVLMSASGLGDDRNHDHSLALAKKVEASPNFVLALDARKRIEQQYRDKMRQGTFGQAWLMRLFLKEKINYIPWGALPKGARVALEQAHFDREDYKYVETAARAKCGVIVSHDPDYSPRVQGILGQIDVFVCSAEEICSDP
jgi:hypothetical protein